jgi:hypothetical protein
MTKRLDVCSICLEGENVDCQLNCCGAEFHLHCLTRWTSYSSNSKTCPKCRQENTGSWPDTTSQGGGRGGSGGWFAILYLFAKSFEISFGPIPEDNRVTQRLTQLIHTPSTRGCVWSFLESCCRGNYFKLYCAFFLMVFFLTLLLLASVVQAHSGVLVLNWNTMIVASLYTMFVAFLCDFFAAIRYEAVASATPNQVNTER